MLLSELSAHFVSVEALRNAIKHSGAQHVEVGLWRTPDEIHLAVSDRGVGFASKAARESPGLGLVSMEERLKLLKGSISIESQPNRDTTIHPACLSVEEAIPCVFKPLITRHWEQPAVCSAQILL